MNTQEENVNVFTFVKEKLNAKPKKVKRKTKKVKKVSKPKSKSPSPKPKPKPVELPPILSDELEIRIKYCNKRMFYCKSQEDKLKYKNHLVKLSKRRVIMV